MRASQAAEDIVEEQRLRNNRPATIACHERVLGILVDQTGVEDVDEITRRTLTKWRFELQSRDLSPATVQTHDKAVKVFLAWATRNDMLRENPREGMPPLRAPRGTGGYVTFTQVDVKAMLVVASGTGHRNRLRDTASIATLLDTGIRVGGAAPRGRASRSRRLRRSVRQAGFTRPGA
ncbi:MAG: hypothetical protein P8099_18780 [Gemmatimonadota bacterium]